MKLFVKDGLLMLTGNYLVTGATGLMGSHTLLRLSNAENVRVRAVYHAKSPHIFADNITYVQADLRNADECNKVVGGIDYVLMYAGKLSTAPVMAKDPISHVRDNMTMNALMLEASYLAGVRKFLWLGSSTGYPQVEGPINEDDMFAGDPPDYYFSVGWMSRYTEILCRMYSTKIKRPMTTVILRPTTLYGEYEDFDSESSHVLPALIRKVVERQNPIEVWGTGENRRDLLYAGDMADACMTALKNVDTFDYFNVGFGREYSINEMLALIMEIDHSGNLEIVHDTSKPATINRRKIDITKSKMILGFEARTTLREGLSRVIKWYRKYRLVEESKLLSGTWDVSLICILLREAYRDQK